MVIDANGIRTKKYNIFGKIVKNEFAWKDLNTHSFSVNEPLAEVNSFFQFIKYLADKEDRFQSDFPQVSIDIFEDVTDYIYITDWNEIGNATIWNVVKEEKGGETIYRCSAAIYDDNSKLISSSSDRYIIGSTLYESDGSIVNGWKSDPDDDIDEIDDMPVFFNLEDCMVIYLDEGRQYEENGKKFISVDKYNINADFAGSAAQTAAAINHFAAKDLIDAESVEAMYRKALKYHLMLIALVVIVLPLVLCSVAAFLGYSFAS